MAGQAGAAYAASGALFAVLLQLTLMVAAHLTEGTLALTVVFAAKFV